MNNQVLLTGASGFLGRHLIQSWPAELITTLGTTELPGFKHIQVDLQKPFQLDNSYQAVVHAAGKAHTVPANVEAQSKFYQVNVEGTRNLLQALERSDQKPQYFVFISSVSVYGLSVGKAITEEAPLLAEDAYGVSKIEAEKMISKWCDHNQVLLTILRLPLVCGIDPPGNLLKMIQAVRTGRWVHIKQGAARRSMVLASDVAQIIPAAMQKGGTYNLTDGQHPSYGELYKVMARFFNKGKARNMPWAVAKLVGKLGDIWGPQAPFNSKTLEKLSQSLTFSDEQARVHLSWDPRPVLENFDTILLVE
ncbi:MAG: NAD-dependent epimerase/dehydratase family protein [Cyclobacteriaceae bacterium]|nr:NAD-dependent epimerase/dehydratase family protein [Cyclobacteriaceae bacterium]